MQQGELLKDLENANIRCYYYNKRPTNGKKVINKVVRKLQGFENYLEHQLIEIHKEFQPDFWYLNTLLVSPMLHAALKYKIDFVVHFHEMPTYGYPVIGADELSDLVTESVFTVGCSEIVCEGLRTLGSPNVKKQYECIDTTEIDQYLRDSSNFRERLRLQSEATIVIGMSGTRDVRKGVDLFIKTAEFLRDKDVHFVWLGKSNQTGYDFYCDQYIKAKKLTNITFICPSPQDYYRYFNSIDIFFLSSREDPFPLVMLEAAYLDKFIIAFDSGGVTELLKEEQGFVVEQQDASMAAQAISDAIETKSYQQHERINVFKYSALEQMREFESLLETFYTDR